MSNYSQPHSAYSLMMKSKENVKLVTDAAQKGIDLLGKQIDYQLLLAFQNYVVSVLNLASNNIGKDYIYLYNQFILSITYLSPYEQLKKNIEFLLNLARTM